MDPQNVQRDLGRHDADIAVIKDDIAAIKSSVSNINNYVVAQQAKDDQQEKSEKNRWAVTSIIASVFGIGSNFLFDLLKLR